MGGSQDPRPTGRNTAYKRTFITQATDCYARQLPAEDKIRVMSSHVYTHANNPSTFLEARDFSENHVGSHVETSFTRRTISIGIAANIANMCQ